MIKCKHCGNEEKVKYGILKKKQRYKCKSCFKIFCEGDGRQKYDIDKKLKVINCYLEGAGIRSISRREGVSAPNDNRLDKKFCKNNKR